MMRIKKLKIGLAVALLWLDALATVMLVFILIGLWVFRDRVFTIGNPLGLVDLIMLFGMVSILLFNIVSLFWLKRTRFSSASSRSADAVLLGLGVLCIVMMIVEKVMADDIAHETA